MYCPGGLSGVNLDKLIPEVLCTYSVLCLISAVWWDEKWNSEKDSDTLRMGPSISFYAAEILNTGKDFVAESSPHLNLGVDT